MTVGVLHGVPRDPRHERALLAVAFVLVCADAGAFAALWGLLAPVDGASAGATLLAAAGIWAANVVAFGLVCKGLDRDLSAWENPVSGAAGVRPRLLDYLYVSFASSIAFSPTCARPLSRRARLVVLVESALSVATVLLVAERLAG